MRDSPQERPQRPQPSERIHSILTATSLREKLADPEAFRAWIKTSNFEGFLDLLIGLNNVVQGKRERPIDRNAITKGAGVGHLFLDPFYLAPDGKDRTELLRKTYEATCQLISEKREDDAALLLFITLQSIHPFEEGNGRTGRALYMLLHAADAPASDPDSMKNTLSVYLDRKEDNDTYEGRNAFSHFVEKMTTINPIVYRQIAKDALGPGFSSKYHGVLRSGAPFTYANKLSQSTRDELQLILSERDGLNFQIATIAFVRILQKRDLLEKYQAEMHRKDDKTPYSFKIDQVVRDFSEEDMTEVLREYWNLKKAVVEKIIDVIVNERNYLDPETRGRTTIKESFYTY